MSEIPADSRLRNKIEDALVASIGPQVPPWLVLNLTKITDAVLGVLDDGMGHCYVPIDRDGFGPAPESLAIAEVCWCLDGPHCTVNPYRRIGGDL